MYLPLILPFSLQSTSILFSFIDYIIQTGFLSSPTLPLPKLYALLHFPKFHDYLHHSSLNFIQTLIAYSSFTCQ